jgi:signal transduction histidine kinase
MNLSKRFGEQPRSWIIAEMAVAVVVIGSLDFITSYKFRLLPFYAGPIFVMAWFFGKGPGIATALVSGWIWWCANWYNGDPDLHSWVQAWEIFRHVGSFLVVAWVGAALRMKSDSAAARIRLLEHTQRLEREIVNISESEQRRIGQDLHDGICQHLAALTCSAVSLRDDLQKLELDEESKTAAELATLLQDAVVQTRDLSRELVPAHVGQVGLVIALDGLAQSVSRLRGIGCTFEFRGAPANYGEQTATHLYRIAQEAINNATKHGKARNIAISLEASDDLLTLRVQDDGAGISNLGANEKGMGLAIMRYRARLTGAELAVEQPAEGGTLVLCSAIRNPHEGETDATQEH